MISIQLHFDLYDPIINLLVRYVESYALKVSADVLITDIQDDSKQGVDADRKRFIAWTPRNESDANLQQRVGATVYSPAQHVRRQKAGVQTATKDLSVSDLMLKSLKLYGDSVTVAPEYERVAHGQMFNPKWRYHHEFLSAGKDSIKRIEVENALRIYRL